jgi:C_GCAxxG_C_C family probable redox protein
VEKTKGQESTLRITRRDILKVSLVAGMTLATSEVSGVTLASTVERAPDNRPEYAKGRFLKSMNCSQAILETYGPAMGLPVESARRVAAAFAGGMGMGSECGAVTGAFLVIGMKYGRIRDSDSRADKETFKRVAEFVKEFKARYTYINCSELLKVDMGTPEGVKEASRKGLFNSLCPSYVKAAAEILDKILV